MLKKFIDFIKKLLSIDSEALQDIELSPFDPLIQAYHQKNYIVLHQILSANTSYYLLNSYDFGAHSILHMAAKDNDMSATRIIVEIIKSKNHMIDSTNCSGYSALWLAAMYNNYDIVEYLLEQNADPTLLHSSTGLSMLMLPRKKFSFYTQILESPFVNQDFLNIEDKNGYDALYYAYLHDQPLFFQKLIDHQVSYSKIYEFGHCILYKAVQEQKFDFIKIIMSQTLIYDNFNFSASDNNLLWLVIDTHQNVQIFEYLLNKYVPYNITRNGQTMLMMAVRYNYVEIVKLLGVKNDLLNLTDNQNNTALKFAFQTKNLSIFQYLLQIGADYNIHNYQSKSLLHEIAASNNLQFLQIIVEQFRKDNYDINFLSHIEHNNCTALWIATERGNIDVINCLLEHGADPTIADNIFQHTPLMRAVHNDYRHIVEILINKTDTINIRSIRDNSSALDIARQDKNSVLTQILRSHCESSNKQTKKVKHKVKFHSIKYIFSTKHGEENSREYLVEEVNVFGDHSSKYSSDD